MSARTFVSFLQIQEVMSQRTLPQDSKAEPLLPQKSNDSNGSSLNAIKLRQYIESNVHSRRDIDEERSSVYTATKKTPEEIQRWFQYKMYSFYNSIRFAIIAIIVFWSNFSNQHEIETYDHHCCDCYFVAMNPSTYNIPKGYRIDWSYCFPKCVDCTYCRDHYITANESFNTTQTCNPDDYTPTKRKASTDWYDNCPHALSFTSLSIFLKDYRIYGIATVIIVAMYIALMIAFVFCLQSYAGINSGASLLVYNVIVSINAVYAMFKPLQYYHKTVDNTPDIVCEVDTISEPTEYLISWCVNASFAFILSQWIIGAIGCCITRKSKSKLIPNKVKNVYIKLEKIMIVCAIMLGTIFYLSLIYASYRMIRYRINEGRLKADAWKISVIVTVEALSILSCIDIFCFPFCKITCNSYFGRGDDQNQTQTYRQFVGRSIDQSEYDLHTLDRPIFAEEDKRQAVL